MHAYLIAGDNPISGVNKVIDSSWMQLPYSGQTIEQIREIISFVQMSVPNNTAIIISDLDKATHEAQNTLLKAVEEPQPNLKFIILTTSEDTIIETIRSRCQIIYTDNGNQNIDDQELEGFFDLSVGQKLTKTTSIKKREDAIEFLQNLIKSNHKNVEKRQKELNQALKTLKAIQSNGNVNLQLTNFVINT